MIRLVTGFFIMFGSVGTLDVDPSASLLSYTFLALAGLVLMAWPVVDGTLTSENI